MGSSTATALEMMAEALPTVAKEGVEYTIMVAHTGVEGVLPGHAGGLSHAQLAPLRPHVDYLALGHVHKPFTFDNWIYNAGSPETCSMDEVAWRDRGYYMVDVDTSRPRGEGEPAHVATLRANRRRPFHRLHVKVDHHTTPAALYEHCERYIRQRAADTVPGLSRATQPVVELRLSGVLPFDRTTLDLERLRGHMESAFQPLICHLKNATQPSDFAVDADEQLDRRQLERQVVTELLNRDSRFRDQSEGWTNLVLDLKNLALANADAETVVAELSAGMDRLDSPVDVNAPQTSAEPA